MASVVYRPISVCRLGEMPTQSCGQSVSAPRGKAGARLNVHTELREKRQRSAREAIYRNRPIVLTSKRTSQAPSPASTVSTSAGPTPVASTRNGSMSGPAGITLPRCSGAS